MTNMQKGYPRSEQKDAAGVADSAVSHILDRQRQELRLLLDSMRSAILYLDQWGLLKDCNILAQPLTEIPLQGGKNFLELYPNWDSPTERQREIMQVIRTGQPLLGSIESTGTGDAQRWFTVDKIPTKDVFGIVNGLLLVMTDITQTVTKEKQLQLSETRYKAFIANSSEAIWRYDMEPPVATDSDPKQQALDILHAARLVECNNVLAVMLGATDINSVLGTGLQDTGSKNCLFDLNSFVRGNYQLVDHEILREDQRGRQMVYQISCVGTVEDGKLTRVWGTTRDITARKRYQAKLEYQATHDALTGLPNRVFLYKTIEKWFHPDNTSQLAALLLIDLDRFKEINDTLGHQVGDHLLQLIGPRLEAELTENEALVVRLGGDEFAIFLPRVRHARQALVLGHRLLDALRQEFDVDDFYAVVSASIGISLAPIQARDISTLMRYADVAMYRAKSEMTGVSLYDPSYDTHSPARLTMITELGRAIREGHLSLHFQPKVDIAERRVHGFEALLRWQHPQLGFVPPGEFIPIVERTSLIHPMTAWVLEQSIRQCSEWHARGLYYSVAVNLSARNLVDDNMPRLVQRLLDEYGLASDALELEITESSIMSDPQRALKVLERLHRLGVRLSIDDFGTGYSSLAYLKRLPVQTLKIDYSFVRNMLEDEQDQIIVNSTIHLAHNLGLKVVAEGVETEPLLRQLLALGCDQAQGYFISRPMPAADALTWMNSSDWACELA